MISPTNVLLVAIACSDMLTGSTPVPFYLHFYATNLHKDWLPYNWCATYQYLTEYLPTIFHTSTIWLTVALAAQRYIYVCHPVRAKLVCTIKNFANKCTIMRTYLSLSGVCIFANFCLNLVHCSWSDGEQILEECLNKHGSSIAHCTAEQHLYLSGPYLLFINYLATLIH
ncbi:hypothetical protein HELRODRAFT_163337 [Helobdella robusta]|uniref:G-protein coupled receptors family 1 profile domain-containing protein n=1 Tax=Helobdella robusta TaxID=6412 RepID=T1ETX6_HELRO|nr:hypothetical protein HELRODRAFT_163337 [Helobdella robusta]ESN96288.1 hypothetical protein HELRODRAFT_163337 [Helobdella robusta]